MKLPILCAALASTLAITTAIAGCRSRATQASESSHLPDSTQTASGGRPKLVGIWRVVRFCDNDDVTGHLYDPLGPKPTGYFVYSRTGQLLIQVMRTPAIKPFAAGDLRPTDAERKELFDAYFGYFGTYTITSDSTVVHHVRGGTSPSFIGSDQRRVYRIRGDTLTIGGNSRTWPCRVLLRLE